MFSRKIGCKETSQEKDGEKAEPSGRKKSESGGQKEKKEELKNPRTKKNIHVGRPTFQERVGGPLSKRGEAQKEAPNSAIARNSQKKETPWGDWGDN